jgi:hypothetical protein
VANTLDYNNTTTSMAVKSLIVQTRQTKNLADVIKHRPPLS